MISLNVIKKRIDELGRVVIPKQIRKNFKINNFDELEMSIVNDTIVLKKCIGIENYKEKLDKFLFVLTQLIDFKIIITDSNNVISSSYEGIEYRNEFKIDVNESSYVETPKLKGFVEFLPIIIDSIKIGDVYFIRNVKFEDKDLLKRLRDVIVDIVN